VFGDSLYFHGTQMFFNPLDGRRRPYWHRDLQYMSYDETRQRALLSELCNLHVRMPLRSERHFMLVPGSHARWDSELERDVRLESSGHHSWEELPSATVFDLEPGDTLIFPRTCCTAARTTAITVGCRSIRCSESLTRVCP